MNIRVTIQIQMCILKLIMSYEFIKNQIIVKMRAILRIKVDISYGYSVSKVGSFRRQQNVRYIGQRLDYFRKVKQRMDKMYSQIDRPKIVIKLQNGKEVNGVGFQTTPFDISKSISKSLTQSAIVAKVRYLNRYDSPINKRMASIEQQSDHNKIQDFILTDLSQPLEGDCELQIINFNDQVGKDVFWHSSAHLLGQSLQSIYGAWLCHGPPLTNGFFYDSYVGQNTISQADYERIQKQIRKSVTEKQPFQKIILSKNEAKEMFKENPFKLQLIEKKIPQNGLTSAYRCGNLIDLCTGPHIPSADKVKGFKITKNSSSYWLGNKENQNLQRVYGISFPKQSMLEQYVKNQEELLKRDHRIIGVKQNLFNFTNLSPGSALFYHHGTIIYNKLIDLMRNQYNIRGYSEVISPNIYNSQLWKMSGHYYKYKENIYWINDNQEEHGIKPMNCPGHCIMFGLSQHSYRDLPIRMADFGVLHRNQVHGSLSGLTRVRRFQQDDGHIFCMHHQIEQQILAVLDLLDYTYSVFGFRYVLQLSTRPQQYLGSLEDWNQAESQLLQALKKFGKEYSINQGDGAFYGPKIDVKLFDIFGRQHQCGTVQLDFQLPLRFNLQYRAKSNKIEQNVSEAHEDKIEQHLTNEQDKYSQIHSLKKGFERPVLIHRAIFGSLQRFIAILCEHNGGKWDFWLSPRQLQIVPVSKNQIQFAERVKNTLMLKGYSVSIDNSSDKLDKKIRNSHMLAYNFIGVIGSKQETQEKITLRKRDQSASLGSFHICEVIEMFEKLKHPPKSNKRVQLQRNMIH